MNVTNGTLTFAQKELLKQQQTETAVQYLIPKKLKLALNPSDGSNETIPFEIQPQLQMFDALDRWVQNVGTKLSPWIVTASLVPGTGDPNARLEGNVSVPFVNGTANFTNLAITHNGTGYQILYNVTYPTSVSFSVAYGAHVIKERQLEFRFSTNFTTIFDSTPFSIQPSVAVFDVANGDQVDTGWKNRQWYLQAELIHNSNINSSLFGTNIVTISNESRSFTNLSISEVGSGYRLKLKVYTIPSSSYAVEYVTSNFNVTERLLTLFVARHVNGCNETVICGQQPIVQVHAIYPGGLAGNLGLKGRSWYINATLCSKNTSNPLLGTTFVKIPKSGEVIFSDLHLDYVTYNQTLCFKAIVDPFESKYSNLTALSDVFSVYERKKIIVVSIPPGGANETIVFGQQPVVDVRDMGTGLSANPLRKPWIIIVSLNTTVNNGVLSGTKTINVVGTNATFTDLAISSYGVGFVLKFESNDGQVVSNLIFLCCLCSQPYFYVPIDTLK